MTRWPHEPGQEENYRQNAGWTAELSERLSIAVLPFVNVSNDVEQEYFANGMTEELIADLSKMSELFVISRNSVFMYNGKSVIISQVGRELRVRYVPECAVGSPVFANPDAQQDSEGG